MEDLGDNLINFFLTFNNCILLGKCLVPLSQSNTASKSLNMISDLSASLQAPKASVFFQMIPLFVQTLGKDWPVKMFALLDCGSNTCFG